MAKFYPQSLCSPSSLSSCSNYLTSCREVFTVWMKSLVLNSNGCTVFDSNGTVVYRVDNYDEKCRDEVYLMDLKGKVLSTVVKKKLRVFGCWEGYKCNGSSIEKEKPWFRVRKSCNLLHRDPPCTVSFGRDKDQLSQYKMVGSTGKSACKIVDQAGGLVAEIKQKQSASGVGLGDDVWSLVVEPNTDHSLIMALVVVHGLINHRM